MSDQDNNDWPESWPGWVIEIARRLEESVGKENCLDEWGGFDGPHWVQQMTLELIRIMHPTVVSAKRETSGPHALGAMIGHHQWLLGSDNGINKQLERTIRELEIKGCLLRNKLTPEQYRLLEKAGEKIGAILVSWLESFDRIINNQKMIIAEAHFAVEKAPLNERAEFYEAYGKALKMELFDDQGRPAYEKLSSATNIYFLMVANWVGVKKLRSVTELHSWLCRVLGAEQVGDLDRVKGICKRYHVKLASRGRPRKKMGH